MKRYDVPRVAFINKLDRTGADPWRVISQARLFPRPPSSRPSRRRRPPGRLTAPAARPRPQVRDKLKGNCAAVQVPMGVEDALGGVVDIVRRRAAYFDGDKGEVVRFEPVPEQYKALMEAKRVELIERVAEVDDRLAELYLEARATRHHAPPRSE